MKKYIITAVYKHTRTEYKIEIFADEAEKSPYVFLTTYIRENRYNAGDKNHFKAFQKLRDQILGDGYILNCCGALKNAVQSGAQQTNDKIYLAEIGRGVYAEDEVSIYDYAQAENYTDTYEQDIFCSKWIKSLGKLNKIEGKQ